MNSESQLLGKKRYINDDEILINTKSLIKKCSKQIRKVLPHFKLCENQENTIINRISHAYKEKSDDCFIKILSEVTGFKDNENLDDVAELSSPIKYILNSDKLKRRIYDIDSNKKLLRKNIWNYIEEQVFQLSNIKNIKPLNNHIKHNTKKEFEKDLMDTPIKRLYENHYNLKIEIILQNIIIDQNQYPSDKKSKNLKKNNFAYDLSDKHKKENILMDILNKTFKQLFIEYRESKIFWEDAKVDCKNDLKKLDNYIEVARKFINYVNNKEKVNLPKLYDDDTLPDNFIQNYENLKNYKLEYCDSKVNNCNTSIQAEEINNNRTTCSITNHISTVMSSYKGPDKVDVVIQTFKNLDSKDQSHLYQIINDYMKNAQESSHINNSPYNRNEVFPLNNYINFFGNDSNSLSPLLDNEFL